MVQNVVSHENIIPGSTHWFYISIPSTSIVDVLRHQSQVLKSTKRRTNQTNQPTSICQSYHTEHIYKYTRQFPLTGFLGNSAHGPNFFPLRALLIPFHTHTSEQGKIDMPRQ